ncbi:MAG: hypothetical protein V1871_07640 [Planctomycetota bacterium]
MLNEFGKCCKCGEEISPYDRNNEDWLCKQCYDKTHRRYPFPNPRINDERILSADERIESEKWKDEIIDKVDREATDYTD